MSSTIIFISIVIGPLLTIADSPVINKPTNVFRIPINRVTGITISPDASIYAVTGYEKYPTDKAWSGFYYNLSTGKYVSNLPEFCGYGSMTTDGKKAAVYDVYNNKIKIFDIINEKQILDTGVNSREFALTNNGKLLVYCSGKSISFVSAADGKPIFPKVETDSKIMDLSKVYADDVKITTLHQNGLVLDWDLKTGKQCGKFELNRDVRSEEELSIAEDGLTAIFAEKDTWAGQVWHWDTKKKSSWVNKDKSIVPMPNKLIRYVDFDESAKKCIKIAESDTNKVIEELHIVSNGRLKLDSKAHHSSDGLRIAACSDDFSHVFVWNRLSKK